MAHDTANLTAGASQNPEETNPQAIVERILTRAVELRASDIHIEPRKDSFLARYRIDGTLRQADEQPMAYHNAVLSRIKIMANLDITETRRPQDGHILATFTEFIATPIDVRVSIFPTVFGETAVLRLLNRKEYLFENFETMGMDEKSSERMRSAIRKPHGMILVTGPSGSGKTTTLYTALNQLRSVEKNIITLEDPVEYQLDLVRHAQINPHVGFTFTDGLRSILRQDPDIVMIGEIRDQESAEISIRAALAGRLLFSTMHTNDSIGAVVRFLEFGMPRSFVASALRAVLAQRLIRLNCLNCVQTYVPTEPQLHEAGIVPNANVSFQRGMGCDVCFGGGYNGRQAIFEFFPIDRDIELRILEGASYRELWQAAREKGEKTLREHAVALALEGKTTLEEAVHVTA